MRWLKSHAGADEKHDINFHWPYEAYSVENRTTTGTSSVLVSLHCMFLFQYQYADKFLAFKTFLGPRYDEQVPEANQYHVPMLLMYLEGMQVCAPPLPPSSSLQNPGTYLLSLFQFNLHDYNLLLLYLTFVFTAINTVMI